MSSLGERCKSLAYIGTANCDTFHTVRHTQSGTGSYHTSAMAISECHLIHCPGSTQAIQAVKGGSHCHQYTPGWSHDTTPCCLLRKACDPAIIRSWVNVQMRIRTWMSSTDQLPMATLPISIRPADNWGISNTAYPRVAGWPTTNTMHHQHHWNVTNHEQKYNFVH